MVNNIIVKHVIFNCGPYNNLEKESNRLKE